MRAVKIRNEGSGYARFPLFPGPPAPREVGGKLHRDGWEAGAARLAPEPEAVSALEVKWP